MKKLIDYIKHNKEYIIFCFFIISALGWLLEMSYSLIFRNKLVYPGVLYGPWCPVYGITFVFLLLCINTSNHKVGNIIKIFLIVSFIEYFTSYLCEKLLHRLIWNYSKFPLNINDRICLHMSIIFAFFSYIGITYAEKPLRYLYQQFSHNINL